LLRCRSDVALQRRPGEAMAAWAWQGRRVAVLQPLCWPRVDVPGVGSDAVPLGVKASQCALAIELHRDDTDPPEQRRGAVVRKKVDVMEVEFANVTPPSPRPRASLVLADAYLRPARIEAVRS